MDKLPFEKVKVKILTKQKYDINLKIPKRSAVELINAGIINLDKPSGPKSIHAVNKVKGAMEIYKAGHAGTLDPLVTGVLPVGLNKGVKVLPVLSVAGKIYQGKMHVHKEVPLKKIKEAFEKFTGEIEQLPPKISAVARKLRKRTIYFFNIDKIDNKDVYFTVGCEAGTYIRKLCHDMGEYLGCGANMAQLRRLQSGPFKIKDSVTLEKVKENYFKYLETKNEKLIQDIVCPLEEGVMHLAKIWVDDDVIERLRHGSPVFAPGIVSLTSNIEKGKYTAVFDIRGNLLAIGIAEMDSKEIMAAEKGLAVKTDFVLI